ncbi:MAG: Mor transcription activator family protein [Aeromonas caviae]|nr:Mor transcription activator family protein [Aeromonas caviae]
MSAGRDKDTIDMFGCEVDRGEVAAELDRLFDDGTGHGWPEVLRELYNLIERVVEEHTDFNTFSITLLSEICNAFGGDEFYLPKGKRIAGILRGIRVWKEFKGNNAFELSRKYDVSVREIQYIIARMRRVEKRRRQPDLFDGSDDAVIHPARKNGRPY